MTDRNKTSQTEGYLPIPMLSEALLIRKRLLQDKAMSGKTAPFRYVANKFRRLTILQLNIEDLTASKINVLHYLALQFEALVILLQKTHCINAKKLVLPSFQLARSFISRKHGLSTFVHERLRCTLLDQSPLTSEIGWLCMNVDGYKIVRDPTVDQTTVHRIMKKKKIYNFESVPVLSIFRPKNIVISKKRSCFKSVFDFSKGSPGVGLCHSAPLLNTLLTTMAAIGI